MPFSSRDAEAKMHNKPRIRSIERPGPAGALPGSAEGPNGIKIAAKRVEMRPKLNPDGHSIKYFQSSTLTYVKSQLFLLRLCLQMIEIAKAYLLKTKEFLRFLICKLCHCKSIGRVHSQFS